MSQDLLDKDTDTDHVSDDLESGRMFLFWCPQAPDGMVFYFSSTLENVGVIPNHDRQLKNKTKVFVLSEPTEANHPKLGKILVSKVMAHAIMWVGTHALHPINES